MNYTGERFIPGDINIGITLEHWHRYFIARQYAAGMTVLDIACGEGYGSAVLAQKAEKVYGIDIDQEAVQLAKDRYMVENLEFLHGSIADIGLPDASIDLLVSFETIEHVDETVQARFLDEAVRVLKPDGILLISTPDRYYYTDVKTAKNDYHLKEFYHQEFHSFLSGKFSFISYGYQNKLYGSYLYTESSHEINRYAIEKSSSGITEYQSMDHEYILAVCSNHRPVILKNSMTIDVKNEVFRECFQHWNAMAAVTYANLYVDEGQGFSESGRLKVTDPMGRPSLEFDLTPFNPVRRIRLDPFNTSLIFRVNEIRLVLKDGRVLDHIKFSWTNAFMHEKDVFYFVTDGPSLVIDLTREPDLEVETIIFFVDYLKTGNAAMTEIADQLLGRFHEQSLNLEKALNKISALNGQIHRLETVQQMLETERQWRGDQVLFFQEWVSRTYESQSYLHRVIEGLNQQYLDLTASTSWRVTRPLRSVSRFVRNIKDTSDNDSGRKSAGE